MQNRFSRILSKATSRAKRLSLYFLSTSIEIEKKFICTPSILNYCRENSFSITDVIMSDTYYDHSSYALTKKDMWLRCRNEKLELKWPQEAQSVSIDISGTDFYLETSDLNEISRIIKEKTAISVCPTDDVNYSWLLRENIIPFGTIKSIRRRHVLTIELDKCSINENDHMNLMKTSQSVFIDIDNVTFYPHPYPLTYTQDHHIHLSSSLCDDDKTQAETTTTTYQYMIGEIEFCNDKELASLTRSEQELIMKRVFSVIGIDESKPVRGKVLEFLYRFSPSHYQALEDCGQLASKGIPIIKK